MQQNKKYTHLFFDLDNTLWDFEKNAYSAMSITFEKIIKPNQVDFNTFFQVYSKHNDELWQKYRERRVTKRDLIKSRFQLTFDHFRIDGLDPETVNAFYLSEMAKQSILVDSALDVLTYLKGKKYKLFIITNGFKEVQLKKIENAGLSSFFDKVFISEEIKIPKPGREIFEYAIKSSNAKKKQSLMIGDDWEVDIQGAVNFGIDAVYYSSNSFNFPVNQTGVRVVHHICELQEIL